MATVSERIDAINAILERGIDKVVDQDGRTHEYDFETLIKERDRLARQQSGSTIRRGRYNPYFRT